MKRPHSIHQTVIFFIFGSEIINRPKNNKEKKNAKYGVHVVDLSEQLNHQFKSTIKAATNKKHTQVPHPYTHPLFPPHITFPLSLNRLDEKTKSSSHLDLFS